MEDFAASSRRLRRTERLSDSHLILCVLAGAGLVVPTITLIAIALGVR